MIKLKFKPQICFDSWTKNVKYHHIIVIGNKGPKDKWLKVILGVKLYSITISYHNTPDVSNASSVQYWLLVTIHYWPYQYNTSRQINIRAGRKIRIWGQPIYSNSQIKRFQSRNTFLQCLVSMHGVKHIVSGVKEATNWSIMWVPTYVLLPSPTHIKWLVCEPKLIDELIIFGGFFHARHYVIIYCDIT